jgi:hypothetical protein
MMAAQLIAAYAAAMECYRGGATADSFERRRDELNQAVRLSRAFVALLAALQRRRERAQKAAMSAEGARNAKSSKQPVAARGAPVSADANSAKPQAPLAPNLPVPPAQAQRAAAVTLNAESAKQPSAAGPAIVRPQPGAGEGTAAMLRFVGSEPARELIEFAKQPWPIAPALGPGPLALTCRTPGVRRAALVARLMEGTSLRNRGITPCSRGSRQRRGPPPPTPPRRSASLRGGRGAAPPHGVRFCAFQ